MIVPLVIAVPGLLACALLGWAIDRALGWELDRRGALRWASRALAGVVVVLAFALHPLALVALTVLAWLERRLFGSAAQSQPRDRRVLEPSRGGVVVLGVAAMIASLRPAVPLYWDEHVWLAKVRLAGVSALSLRAASLDPDGDVLPRGYPILGSLAEALFALGRADVASLVAGAAALVLLALAVSLAAMRAEHRVPWALALATAPLLWIHLRSAYLDLTVGLLAVALAASLARVRAGERALPLALLSAFLLAGTKDEGLAHALALGAAHVVASGDRGIAAKQGALAIAPALVAALTWRILLATHGVAPRDHALDGAGLADAGAITLELARAATDVSSWGAAWPIVLGAALATLRLGATRGIALALLFSALALWLGLLLGSEHVRAFTLTGTLANRLLIQLAPLAAWLVAETLASAPVAHSTASRDGLTSSNTAHGCHAG